MDRKSTRQERRRRPSCHDDPGWFRLVGWRGLTSLHQRRSTTTTRQTTCPQHSLHRLTRQHSTSHHLTFLYTSSLLSHHISYVSNTFESTLKSSSSVLTLNPARVLLPKALTECDCFQAEWRLAPDPMLTNLCMGLPSVSTLRSTSMGILIAITRLNAFTPSCLFNATAVPW